MTKVMNKISLPLAKLVGALILLPAAFVYLHLHRTIYKSNYCLVGPTESFIQESPDHHIKTQNDDLKSSYYGIYTSAPIHPEKTLFLQIYASATTTLTSSWYQRLFSKYGWPSSPILASELILPISNLSSSRKKNANEMSEQQQQSPNLLRYVVEQDKWCLFDTKYSTVVACSDDSKSSSSKEYFPRSGVWSSPISSTVSMHVTCPASTTVPYHKKNQNRQNKNLEFILSHPTTTMLILLNTGLAYYYWNYRISPSSVSKNYSKILHNKEIWRGFTGSLAHFELYHLGFNMMSLMASGQGLEEWGYGSIPFLNLNISLIAFTTIVMMLITKLRIHYASSAEAIHALTEQHSVGYSGVLFAWMAIMSMEQKQSCPIFFLPDLCYESFYLYKDFSFNVAPLVSLVVMQMILPRISFVGHLSGIICGFALHWGILRLEFCLPHVWGSIMILWWLFKVEKVETRDELYLLDDIALEEEDEEQQDETNTIKESMRQVLTNFFSQQATVQERTKSYLRVTNYGLILVSFVSIFFFDFGIILAQCISTFLFHCASSSFINSEGKKHNYTGLGHQFRGYLITSLLLVVTDAMSLPGWWIARDFVSANRSTFISTSVFVIMMIGFIRVIVNLWGFILAVKMLADIGELSGGPCFKIVLGWLLGNGRSIGDVILSPMYRAFEGTGRVLGHGNNSNRVV